MIKISDFELWLAHCEPHLCQLLTIRSWASFLVSVELGPFHLYIEVNNDFYFRVQLKEFNGSHFGST